MGQRRWHRGVHTATAGVLAAPNHFVGRPRSPPGGEASITIERHRCHGSNASAARVFAAPHHLAGGPRGPPVREASVAVRPRPARQHWALAHAAELEVRAAPSLPARRPRDIHDPGGAVVRRCGGQMLASWRAPKPAVLTAPGLLVRGPAGLEAVVARVAVVARLGARRQHLRTTLALVVVGPTTPVSRVASRPSEVAGLALPRRHRRRPQAGAAIAIPTAAPLLLTVLARHGDGNPGGPGWHRDPGSPWLRARCGSRCPRRGRRSR
mmetsp:Transcript_81350/g.209396  ORF Transcript_81350/g.209396 Transcript_81350/m.209396 type:complete len:267 (-) Transcript_81350:281-1081(-)